MGQLRYVPITVLSKCNNVGYGVTILDHFGSAIEQ
jgi:hypothetical protein